MEMSTRPPVPSIAGRVSGGPSEGIATSAELDELIETLRSAHARGKLSAMLTVGPSGDGMFFRLEGRIAP